MARKFFTPIADATLFESLPNRNTGFDEILEVGKTADGQERIRSLLKFDATAISNAISAGVLDPGATFFLKLRIANAARFQQGQRMEVARVSASVSYSWEEGTGYFAQDLKNPQDGASWTARTSTQDWPSGSEGADWETAGKAPVIFDFKPEDPRIDISGIVRDFVSASYNNGIMLKFPLADESSSLSRGIIKFFSRQTHTIHQPVLEAVWNSQVIDVKPESGLNSVPEDFEIFISNVRSTIASGSHARIRIGVRPLNPIKTFHDTFRYGNKYYLPSGSWYSIIDAGTGDAVIPFDEGSRLNADGTGSYFDLSTENMYINRSYKVLLRVERPWGRQTYDTNQTFRVVR